jgi:hypothetical protein
MVDIDYNIRTLGDGKEGPHIPAFSGAGLGNTNPSATRGFMTVSGASPEPASSKRVLARDKLFLLQDQPASLQAAFEFEMIALNQLMAPPAATLALKPGAPLVMWGRGGLTANAEILPRARALKPAGQVVLFQKIMEDWSFSDKEAATLLGFEAALDIRDIYLGLKPVRHRDGKDRLRAILRIATDLDALFEEVAAIRDWLGEPQRDLDGATPRSLLTEGSMENLLRVKSYVAYLSGR